MPSKNIVEIPDYGADEDRLAAPAFAIHAALCGNEIALRFVSFPSVKAAIKDLQAAQDDIERRRAELDRRRRRTTRSRKGANRAG